jgi:hypothetical protein
MTNINQQKVIFIISMTCQVEERVATSFSFQFGRVAAPGSAISRERPERRQGQFSGLFF